MSEVTITLNQIRQHHPCEDSWKKALRALGKTQADDTAVTFDWIVHTCGLDDALWALRCLQDEEQWRSRLFARWCALQVTHLWGAPKVVKEYLRTGNEDLRAAAETAAWAAARAAARAAAWAAAETAAWAAARAAARAAAGDAARAAAGAAARDAAWDAAWDAARDAQAAKLIEIMSLVYSPEALILSVPEGGAK